MAFIKAAIADAREPELVPESEYGLEILSHKCFDSEGNQVDDDGDPARINTVIRIDSNDHPNAELIYHTVWLKGDEQYAVSTMRDLRRFLHCFSIPYEADGFNPEDLDEATGRSTVYQKEGKDGIIRLALRLPRVPSDATVTQSAGRGRRGSAKPQSTPAPKAASGRRR